MNQPVENDWHGRTAVIATMHQKERIIGPLLEAELGLSYVVPKQFNTDAFGTFTRDITRVTDQLETAKRKARAAMELTGHTTGIASEGSFGTHPSVPFIQSNFELVVLLDSERNLEIVGHHRTGAVQVKNMEVETVEEAVVAATTWGFPMQGVIVRAKKDSSRYLYKDIQTIEELEHVVKKLLSRWFTKRIFLETDMRAHRCPARQESIRQATLDLIKNYKLECPQCQAPGFVITDVIRGLPCRDCHTVTDLPLTSIRTCKVCGQTEETDATSLKAADPALCPHCNP